MGFLWPAVQRLGLSCPFVLTVFRHPPGRRDNIKRCFVIAQERHNRRSLGPGAPTFPEVPGRRMPVDKATATHLKHSAPQGCRCCTTPVGTCSIGSPRGLWPSSARCGDLQGSCRPRPDLSREIPVPDSGDERFRLLFVADCGVQPRKAQFVRLSGLARAVMVHGHPCPARPGERFASMH